MSDAPRKPSSLTSRQAVLDAIQAHDDVGEKDFRQSYGYGTNTTYALTYRGKHYAPKPIMGAAYGFDKDTDALVHSEFSGGPETNKAYERLGFFVRHLAPPTQAHSAAHLIEEIITGYLSAKQEAFAKHAMQQTLQDLGVAIGTWLEPATRTKVKASSGKGTWTHVPWVSCMDSRITTSAQSGFYPCLLFRADMTGFYLVLMAGATEVGAQDGQTTAHMESLRQAFWPSLSWLTARGFSARPIDLRASHRRPKSYEDTTIIQKFYDAESLPSDEVLHDDLTDLFSAYQELVYVQQHQDESTPPVIAPEPSPQTSTLADVAASFCEALWSSGLRFGRSLTHHDHFATSFLASCVTKPFVILTGLSGSGKTQLAKQLGRWCGPHHSKIIPVRPDWTGPDALLGYEDALLPVRDGTRAWHVPATLEFMLHAALHPDELFVLILDEMNLAHVERYFADLLSGMESKESVLPWLARDEQGYWRPNKESSSMGVPANLIIIGTVNVDETTYMFSPKVLDRANTIEFRVHSDSLELDATPPTDIEPGPRHHIVRLHQAVIQKREQNDHVPSWRAEYAAHLKQLHRILSERGFEFGHRVFHEALRFASIHHAMSPQHTYHEPLDRQVMQKLLPRLHGARRQIEPVLHKLASYAWSLDPLYALSDPLDPPTASHDAKLPVSFAKLQHMIRRVRINQFVSFAE